MEAMCIHNSILKESGALQKDIPLEEMLTGDKIAYMSEDELKEKYDEGWRELKFATFVRSYYTNLVVYYKGVEKNLFYHTFGKVGRFKHKGYDLIMYLSSLSLNAMLNDNADREEFNKMMFGHSAFDVRGFYYDGLIDPIVYSVILIHDKEFVDFLVPNLADFYSTVHIKEIPNMCRGNVKALLDEIIVLEQKGDSNAEESTVPSE